MSEPPSSRSSSDLDAKLQAELEAALGDMSIDDMVDLPAQSQLGKAAPPAREAAAAPTPPPAPPPPSPSSRPSHRPRSRGAQRQRKSGRVVNVHGNDVFVEFGPRMQGVCPLDQFPELPKLGETFEFVLNRFDPDDELYILSREGSIQKAEWDNMDVGQTVEARCTGVNKGGLEMEVAHHKAFMPAGQVDIRHIDKLDVFLGEKMPCEIIELDRARGRIILSRRSHLEAERKQLRDKLLEQLDVGQTLPAVITSIKPYGAFADLGGLDGLIHISDLSYERIRDPSQVVKEGQQVQVRVLKIDTTQEPPRIGLGMKQLQADPFEQTLTSINVGDDVTGKVTRLMQFGAFVAIAPGVEGLLHISEMSHQRISAPSKVVSPDEIITARVLSIDPETKRISLSLKALRDSGGIDEAEVTREFREREGKGQDRHGKGGRRQDDRPERGDRAERRDRKPDPDKFLREEDPHLRKLKAQLAAKFSSNLKGGIG